MAKEEIVYKQYIKRSASLPDTDRGLLVPVISDDVDKKNIVELAAELTQLSEEGAR